MLRRRGGSANFSFLRSGAVAAALAAALFLSSCYEISEGTRYLSIISKAQSFDRALADPATPRDLRLLIQEAQAARAYALANFGLKETKNYTKIVVLGTDRLATVVQACAELSFTRYLWNYPIVGKMPYRGYFDPKAAEKEASRLRKDGLDVISRPVDAFSTLGWFPDPLFSIMSSYSEAEVADLIMHEMTHATIFLKGGSPGAEQFNEELATFVGGEGSLLYLASRYGADSPLIRQARIERADAAAFSAYLLETGKRLEAIYSSGASVAEKRKRKAEIIAARAEQYGREYSSIFKGPDYRNFDMGRINNAYIDLYRLYEGDTALYRDFYAKVCGSDMRRFIQAVGTIAKTSGDPKAQMRRRLAAAGAAGAAAQD